MKSVSKSLLVLLAVTSVTQAELPSIPYGFGEDGPAGGAVVLLLSMPDVHSELALTMDQHSKVTAALREHRTLRRQFFNDLVEGKVFDEPVSDADIRHIMAIHSSDFGKKLTSNLLTPKQAKRVRELSMQLKGIAAVFDPEVSTAISTSDTQLAQLLSLRKKISPQLGIQTVEDADRLISSSLSKPQLDRLRGMQGNAFRFEALRARLAAKRQAPPARYADANSRQIKSAKPQKHLKATVSL